MDKFVEVLTAAPQSLQTGQGGGPFGFGTSDPFDGSLCHHGGLTVQETANGKKSPRLGPTRPSGVVAGVMLFEASAKIAGGPAIDLIRLR